MYTCASVYMHACVCVYKCEQVFEHPIPLPRSLAPSLSSGTVGGWCTLEDRAEALKCVKDTLLRRQRARERGKDRDRERKNVRKMGWGVCYGEDGAGETIGKRKSARRRGGENESILWEEPHRGHLR